ncbi:NAD-dependent epimerase/dehydratase family protein [Oscillatoria acuminata]|uniref:NAD dependent epimerase/dehydratase family protein n=1 Tax=Oscillatoria acuminata PCC 6304 TaxID=56110 RepID=K9TEV8_9CYAN|nr:NAD-dependent epimerase/dehydratase family protein [Oscillatoria acuminata]AFY81392.1 NAD dependent epimerase/dehydratase family protein [Oscillatoria acuminata PCC 6304]
MKLVITGGCGLTGSIFLEKISKLLKDIEIIAIVRSTTQRKSIENLNLNLTYQIGDSSDSRTWTSLLENHCPDVVVHIASINHLSILLDSFKDKNYCPHLIVIGSTGVYSKYRQASTLKQEMENRLMNYEGTWCLLRPTLIYGSERDKNLHKLIKFCDRYGFFPVFGSGSSLIQPVYAEDLAKAILTALQRPHIQGSYDLSGGTVVTFRELLTLVGKLLGKPVRQISLPMNIGVWSATIIENLLRERSPVRREQILRLQEDKDFSHLAAQKDLDFQPRSLEEGLKEEIELLKSKKIIGFN